MRRAQGIGINIVVIAAIALLVLLVVVLIVSDSGRNVQEGINNCAVKGGECLSPGEPIEADQEEIEDGVCSGYDVCYTRT